jgi:hypothetical protein
MVTERNFYTTNIEPNQCFNTDLTVDLQRAGVRLFWGFKKIAYVVESKYVSRFVALGQTEEEALEAYGRLIQEPNAWRSVAQEHFQGIPAFDDSDADFDEFIRDSSGLECNPSTYWREVICELLRTAYEIPKEDDTIARVYAFANWCSWQDQPNERDPGRHLLTCSFISFFEYVCFDLAPGALADMPNWYEFQDIEPVLQNYPFDDADRSKVKIAYSKTGRV